MLGAGGGCCWLSRCLPWLTQQHLSPAPYPVPPSCAGILLSPLIPGETAHSWRKLVAVGTLLSLSGTILSLGLSSSLTIGHLKVVAKGVLANLKV